MTTGRTRMRRLREMAARSGEEGEEDGAWAGSGRLDFRGCHLLE